MKKSSYGCKKCICEYDGTAYCGWQNQKTGASIQEVIENRLAKLYNGASISIAASGRTDAGVHALGQVFSFRAPLYRKNYEVTMALNSTLPRDIAVLQTEDVSSDFHAQYSAKSKTYQYVILNRKTRAAIDLNRAWFKHNYIDLELLNKIMAEVEGTRNFTSFCAAAGLKDNMTRTINYTSSEKQFDKIIIRINANGFLHNMVRIIVGTAVTLAIKGGTPNKMRAIMEAKSRPLAFVTAPACGLYLEKVFY